MRVLIISADQSEDTELLVPVYRLREARIHVDIASLTQGTITGKHGYTAEANRTVEDMDANAYSMLVMPTPIDHNQG